MNEPITITGTVGAWLTSSNARLDTVLQVMETDPGEAISSLCFSNYDMDHGSYPWVRVGEAQITVTLFPRDKVAAQQIKVLQAELDAARAKWLTEQQTLLERISKLQAITYEAEPA